MIGFLQNGDSEIADITPLTHQRWPCTKKLYWNCSTNISFQTIYSIEQKLEEGFRHNGIQKKQKSSHSHIKDGHALNSHFGIFQPTSSSKPNIVLIRIMMEGFQQYGGSEIATIVPFINQRWPCTIQPSWNSSTNIFFQTIYSLEQKLKESCRHNGFSEKAKIIPFTHQRWPCTKQPSWNSSTNIFFQTITSLNQKIDGRLPAKWRLRNSLNHPIHSSKMVVY